MLNKNAKKIEGVRELLGEDFEFKFDQFFKKKMALDFHTVEDFFSQIDGLESKKFKLLHREMDLRPSRESPVKKFLDLLPSRESRPFPGTTNAQKRRSS